MISKVQINRITFSLCAGALLVAGIVCLPAKASPVAMGQGEASYGPWHDLMGHFGIQYRLKCDCDSDSIQIKNTWWVEFRNNTGQRVSFDFHIAQAGLSNVHFSDGLAIDAGSSKEGWNQVDASVGSMNLTVYTDHWKYGANAQ